MKKVKQIVKQSLKNGKNENELECPQANSNRCLQLERLSS